MYIDIYIYIYMEIYRYISYIHYVNVYIHMYIIENVGLPKKSLDPLIRIDP